MKKLLSLFILFALCLGAEAQYVPRPASATSLSTGTTAASTATIRGYNTGNSTYQTFVTVTANGTPTYDMSAAVTWDGETKAQMQDAAVAATEAAMFPVSVANGGTNIASYTIGDILYASGATTLAKLLDVATGNVLISGGVGAAPSYGKVTSAHVDSTIPLKTDKLSVFAATTSAEFRGVLSDENGTGAVLCNSASNVTFSGDTTTGNLVTASTGRIDMGSRSSMDSPADGQIRFRASSLGAPSGVWASRIVLNKTSNFTAVNTESNSVYTNAGASGTVNFTLPTAAAAGLSYTFYVDAAQSLTVTAAASTTIQLAGSTSASAGNVTSNTVGNSITIVAISTTKWVTVAHEGTWTVN